MKHKLLMVGAGGMAGNWIGEFLPAFHDRIRIEALVDINPHALNQGGNHADVPLSARFQSIAEAFGTVDADCCAIVIPPAYHLEAVTAAANRGMHILSEKPIADRWEACLEIHRLVTKADIKMQITQNYRYEAPIIAFHEVLRKSDLGHLNYLAARFLADYRKPFSWGRPFRHEIAHALLIEGAIHHFDVIRYLTEGDCRYIAGWDWNPPWSSSKGEFNGLFVMEMTNGVRATYEGSGTGCGIQNAWGQEYYRAECERGSVILDADEKVQVYRRKEDQCLLVEEVALSLLDSDGHFRIIESFLDWLDGGPAPATTLHDNMNSAAMVFGAIEASLNSAVVCVEDMAPQRDVPF